MPDRHDAGVSRRLVLKSAAGAGAAGVAVTALSGMTAASASETVASAPDSRGPADDNAAGETIVAHVRDAATGEIDIFRGTTQTRLHDRELAARLIRATTTGGH
jgi:hypothetical protein